MNSLEVPMWGFQIFIVALAPKYSPPFRKVMACCTKKKEQKSYELNKRAAQRKTIYPVIQ